jgi:hypothetical protein
MKRIFSLSTILLTGLLYPSFALFAQEASNELHAHYKARKYPAAPVKDIISSPVFSNYNISDQITPQNEPSVRISRTNPDIVVAAWRDFRQGWQEPDVVRRIGYSYSHDGGLTWSESQLLPDPLPDHLSQSDPVVTSDSYGNFYISSTSRKPVTNYNRDMLLYRSTDDGQTFELYAVAVPGSGDQGEDKEWIFTDPVEENPTYDNIFIAWRSFGPSTGIKFRKSADNGASWSSTVRVGDGFGGQGANVASGTNGDIYVVWLDGGIWFDVSTDGGVSFGDDRELDSFWQNEHYSFPFICVDYSDKPSRGNIYIAYTKGNEGSDDVFIQRSTDGGVTWLDSPILVNDVTNNDQYWPCIQCDTSGRITIIYYDERTQAGLMNAYMAYSDDQGSTWTNMILSDSPFIGATPNSNVRFGDYIGIDAFAGKIIPVWTDDRDFNYNQEVYTAIVDINTGTASFYPLSGASSISYNYPNPFYGETTISFRLMERSNVRIQIFNAMGASIGVIANKAFEMGVNTVKWNASGYPPGVYLYRLQAGITKETRFMILK